MMSAKVDAMSQKLESLNVNSISSSTPFSSCEICGFVDHFTVNCQAESPFGQDAKDQVNYVNTYNPRPIDNPFSNINNLGQRNQPNFKDQLTLNKHLKNPIQSQC